MGRDFTFPLWKLQKKNNGQRFYITTVKVTEEKQWAEVLHSHCESYRRKTMGRGFKFPLWKLQKKNNGQMFYIPTVKVTEDHL